MLRQIAVVMRYVAISSFATFAGAVTAAEVAVINGGADTYEVAIALTSPGFKTERNGVIRRHQEGMFRIASNVSDSHPWDLVIWKRLIGEADWRFSTAYRIPKENLANPGSTAILSIEPAQDRVMQVYATPGPSGILELSTIEPWSQEVNNGSNSENRPNTAIRLGVNAYKCDEGIHIQNVTPGSAATRCVDHPSGQPVQLESDDHILAVNGTTPRDIPDFQRLIQNSPRTIQLKVLDRRSRRMLNLTTNLW